MNWKIIIKAIAYNNKDFQEGRIADIVSQQYLTLLAYEFQKHQPVEKEDKDILNNLLSSFSD